MRPRLGLDMDGVLYKWTDTARLLVRYHKGIDPGESLSWNHIKDRVPTEVWDWLWSDGITKHGLFRHGNAFKESFEAVQELNDDGWDVVVITTRPPLAYNDTLGWLSYHKIPAREVHMVDFGTKKSTIPCDLYIDDGPDNVLDVAEHGRHALYWRRPWNSTVDVSNPLVVEVSSWSEVLRYSRVFLKAQLAEPAVAGEPTKEEQPIADNPQDTEE